MAASRGADLLKDVATGVCSLQAAYDFCVGAMNPADVISVAAAYDLIVKCCHEAFARDVCRVLGFGYDGDTSLDKIESYLSRISSNDSGVIAPKKVADLTPDAVYHTATCIFVVDFAVSYDASTADAKKRAKYAPLVQHIRNRFQVQARYISIICDIHSRKVKSRFSWLNPDVNEICDVRESLKNDFASRVSPQLRAQVTEMAKPKQGGDVDLPGISDEELRAALKLRGANGLNSSLLNDHFASTLDKLHEATSTDGLGSDDLEFPQEMFNISLDAGGNRPGYVKPTGKTIVSAFKDLEAKKKAEFKEMRVPSKTFHLPFPDPEVIEGYEKVDYLNHYKRAVSNPRATGIAKDVNKVLPPIMDLEDHKAYRKGEFGFTFGGMRVPLASADIKMSPNETVRVRGQKHSLGHLFSCSKTGHKSQKPFAAEKETLPVWTDRCRTETMDWYKEVAEEAVREMEAHFKVIGAFPQETLITKACQQAQRTKAYNMVAEMSTLARAVLTTCKKPNRGVRVISTGAANIFYLIMPCGASSSANFDACVIPVGEAGRLCELKSLSRWRHDGVWWNVFQPIRFSKERWVSLFYAPHKFITCVAECMALVSDTGKPMPTKARTSTITNSLLLSLSVSNNTSAAFDNARYLITNAAADFSKASSYVREKMTNIQKTRYQAVIYYKTRAVLSTIFKAAKQSTYDFFVDEETGEIDHVLTGITEGKAPSLMLECDLGSAFHAVSECYVYFHLCEKGLHGKVSRVHDVHNTPIEYELKQQQEVDLGLPDAEWGVDTPCSSYNIETVASSALDYYSQDQAFAKKVRRDYVDREQVLSHPFLIPTFTSLRSSLYSHQLVTSEELELEVRAREAAARKASSPRDLKIAIGRLGMAYRYSQAQGKLINTGLVKPKSYGRDQREINLVAKKYLDEVRVQVTRPVLDSSVREFWDSDKNLMEWVKEDMLMGGEFFATIRNKGQRTQHDREVYVTNMSMKAGLYILDRFFRQVVIGDPHEMITVPGDDKILRIQSMKDSCLRRLTKMRAELQPGQQIFYTEINADMTKWSPGDNTEKFFIVVAACPYLSRAEKNLMYLILDSLMNKELILDSALFESMMVRPLADLNEKQKKVRDITGGCYSNSVNIRLNWFQGMLNYLSSAVHSMAMKLFSKKIRAAFPDSFVEYFVHSDDNKTSIGIVHNRGSQQSVADTVMNIFEGTLRAHAIRVSDKKTYLSADYAEMVSQINIGGEQKGMWVKDISAAISGNSWLGYEQDVKSSLSKIRAGATRGAPPSVCMVVSEVLKSQIDTVYGMAPGSVNDPVESYGIPRDSMPIAVGGWPQINLPVLVAGNPSSLDSATYVRLLKQRWLMHEKVLCPDLNQKVPAACAYKHMCCKGLQLFEFTREAQTVNLDSNFMGKTYHTTGILQFSRFMSKGTYSHSVLYEKDPSLFEDDKIGEFLDKSPCCSIMKPNSLADMRAFLCMQMRNPAFLASYTNQSQSQLLIERMTAIRGKCVREQPLTGKGRSLLAELEEKAERKVVGNRVTDPRVEPNALEQITLEHAFRIINGESGAIAYANDPEKPSIYRDAMTSFITSMQDSLQYLGQGSGKRRLRCQILPASPGSILLMNPISLVCKKAFDPEGFKVEGRTCKSEESLAQDTTMLMNWFGKSWEDVSATPDPSKRGYMKAEFVRRVHNMLGSLSSRNSKVFFSPGKSRGFRSGIKRLIETFMDDYTVPDTHLLRDVVFAREAGSLGEGSSKITDEDAFVTELEDLTSLYTWLNPEAKEIQSVEESKKMYEPLTAAITTCSFRGMTYNDLLKKMSSNRRSKGRERLGIMHYLFTGDPGLIPASKREYWVKGKVVYVEPNTVTEMEIEERKGKDHVKHILVHKGPECTEDDVVSAVSRCLKHVGARDARSMEQELGSRSGVLMEDSVVVGADSKLKYISGMALRYHSYNLTITGTTIDPRAAHRFEVLDGKVSRLLGPIELEKRVVRGAGRSTGVICLKGPESRGFDLSVLFKRGVYQKVTGRETNLISIRDLCEALTDNSDLGIKASFPCQFPELGHQSAFVRYEDVIAAIDDAESDSSEDLYFDEDGYDAEWDRDPKTSPNISDSKYSLSDILMSKMAHLGEQSRKDLDDIRAIMEGKPDHADEICNEFPEVRVALHLLKDILPSPGKASPLGIAAMYASFYSSPSNTLFSPALDLALSLAVGDMSKQDRSEVDRVVSKKADMTLMRSLREQWGTAVLMAGRMGGENPLDYNFVQEGSDFVLGV